MHLIDCKSAHVWLWKILNFHCKHLKRKMITTALLITASVIAKTGHINTEKVFELYSQLFISSLFTLVCPEKEIKGKIQTISYRMQS